MNQAFIQGSHYYFNLSNRVLISKRSFQLLKCMRRVNLGLDCIFNDICCCYSVAKSFLTLCDPMNCSTPGFPDPHYLPEFAQLLSIESVMPSNHLILCCPLLLPPSIIPSIRVFSNESALHIRWPKYWSFSFNISPSNEYSGLISFTMHWLDLLVLQGTLKSLFQHHSSKASILQCSAFFIVQLSRPYMTTGKKP